jgi:thiol-disulfide isomerase/thioredoxin
MPSTTRPFQAVRLAIGLAALGAIAVAALVLLNRPHVRSATDVAGPLTLPALSFPGINGGMHALSSYRGHPLFINMWATWCPPCRAEIPDLERLYRAERHSGFLVVGVDQGQAAGPVGAFVANEAMTYPVLLDQRQALSTSFALDGLPSTLVYNRAGRLVDVVTGMMTADMMRTELDKARER